MEFIDLQAQRARLGDRIDSAIQRVLAHGQFIMGPEVHLLEEQLATRCHVNHAIACSSGTDALLLPLMAWKVGPGDAVFVPAFTFASTAEVVALLGATPVFVDVLPNTYNIDPISLEAAILSQESGDLRPAGVISVDLFGQPADYPTICDIARNHGLWVLADAAQSFGATIGGRTVGDFADAVTTSFFPAKPLGCYGDGGAVFTSDDTLADTIRSIRSHGQGHHKYQTMRIGINGRLDTIQAAILLEKLAIFDDELDQRRRVARRYHDGLCHAICVPITPDTVLSSWAQYTITLPNRDSIAQFLTSRGIPSAVYYPIPLHQQPAYAHYPQSPSSLCVSETLSSRVLSLPMHPYLAHAQQDAVIEVLLSFDQKAT